MRYQQLGEFETRFLQFLEVPSQPEKPLRFKIVTYSLASEPKYNALSYCWGDPTPGSPIEIDGRLILVSKNLETALRNLELELRDLLWVDAICINQNDLVEKTHQVGRMDRIYSQAHRTIVWLGPEERNTQHAHTFLQEIYANRGTWSRISSLDFRAALRETSYPLRSVRGLYELYTKPYWQRVWVLQEIANSRAVLVRCGSLRFSLGGLLGCYEHVDDLPSHNHSLMVAIERFGREESEAQRGGLRITLMQALIRSRYSLATDPRDKVYALLNLTRDSKDLVPIPSYQEPVEEVFRKLSMRFLRSSQPIGAILLFLWVPLRIRFPSSPWWAVDWADLAYNTPLWLASNLESGNRILGQNTTFEQPRFSSKSIRLRGRGRPLGTVLGTSEHSSPDFRAMTVIHGLNTIMGMNVISTHLLHHFSPRNFNEETTPTIELSIALARMMTLDQEIWGSFSKEHYAKEFSKYVSELKFESHTTKDWAVRFLSYIRLSDMFTENQLVGDCNTGSPTGATEIYSSQIPRNAAEAIGQATMTKVQRTTGRIMSMAVQSCDSRSICPTDLPTASRRLTHLLDTYRQPSLAALRIWYELFSSLDLSPEYRLKLASARYGDLTIIVVVPHGTEEGDEIYELDYCQFPLVLRKRSTGEFNIIGESCIGKDANGNWTAAENCWWLDKNSDSQMQSLSLVIEEG
ncbi:HET-domain-containing protein [Hypoxylon crocopeplum]|nr:HET-domain-containing protein [Hypoxylon crocopeplum]